MIEIVWDDERRKDMNWREGMRVYIESGSQVKQVREHPVIECLTILTVCVLLGPSFGCAASQSSSPQLRTRELSCEEEICRHRLPTADKVLQIA